MSYFSILIFIMSLPLLQNTFIVGDDWQYHLSRIQNIADCLSVGIFPAKIHITSLNGYGYGSGLFYPNLFLYFPAILRVLGLTLSASYKIFLIVVVTFIIISSYFSTKYIFKSRYAAILTATLFITSQAVITNIYFRFAIGESIASIFLPIVMAALYNIVYDGFSKPWILVLGFLGLVYCHTISLFLIGIIFSFGLIINLKTIFLNLNNKIKFLINLFASAFVVLALSISYWGPMLEQFYFLKFNVNAAHSNLESQAFSLISMFHYIRPGVGMILLLLSIIIIIISKKNVKFGQSCIISGIVLVVLSTNIFKWELLNNTIIDKIQFPWRLHPLASFLLSVGVSGCINFNFCKIKQREFFIVIIFTLTSMLSINVLNELATINTIYLPEDICNQYYSIGGGQEWLPLNTDISLLNSPDKVYTSNDEVIQLSKKTGNILYFEYDENIYGKCDYFDVPLVFYKGYSASILTPDGAIKKLNVVNSPNNNLCRVINDKNQKYGEVCIKYSGTKLQKISYLINFLAMIVIGILNFVAKNKESKAQLMIDSK